MIKLINIITQIIIILGCSCAYYKPCADISMCKICFLNANNYLNVLKYIKHNKNKFPLTSTLWRQENTLSESMNS